MSHPKNLFRFNLQPQLNEDAITPMAYSTLLERTLKAQFYSMIQ